MTKEAHILMARVLGVIFLLVCVGFVALLVTGCATTPLNPYQQQLRKEQMEKAMREKSPLEDSLHVRH